MKATVLTVIFLIFQTFVWGQSLSDLQKKKQNAAKEIEYTNRLLKETKQSQQASVNRLRLLNNQIVQRNEVIKDIQKEIRIYDGFIQDNTEVIQMIQEDVESLKKEYAGLIRSAYRNRNGNDVIMFLLSADNFNQAYRRLLYMKRYTSYRHNQAETLVILQTLLAENINRLEEQKEQKAKLAEETHQQTQMLAEEKTAQNQEIQKLQKQQKSLQQKLTDQRRTEQQLEREIQKIIEEEARKSRAAGGSGFALTPEQKLIGDNFEQNKKRLPWPVERGIITEHFGIHPHPVLNNVQIRNNGINIATETGAKVRSVFNGEVSRVFGISGGNAAVIIRHGKYLTVYSNLREVVVKKGDKVSAKQDIGTIFTDFGGDNKSVLKFQIWKENLKLNPEEWIVK